MQDSFDVRGAATTAPFDAADPGPTPLLDFERLDVYRVALEFQALASSIDLPQGRRELRDQLERAALSIVLNTAEGAGRTGAADKARFFAMARGSAMECAAVLDVLRATRIAPWLICVRGRSLLVRIVQMHTRLCIRLQG
jgi:four helix bundle protein